MKFLILLLALLYTPAVVHAADQTVIQSTTEASATTTSTLALASNINRNYLLIQNKGSVTIYVGFGSATTGTQGVAVVSGGNYEPYMVPVGSIYIKSASSTAATVIVEGN